MNTKKLSAILMAMLFSISLIFVINNYQSNNVDAAVFQKINVPKKFRGTWYGYTYNNKLKAFKITRTHINVAGYGDSNNKARTYKYTKKAHNYQYKNPNTYSSHQLIKPKGNRMFMSYPMGENSAAYVTRNRKKLYVGVDTWVDTYYKSKSAARKHHKADKNNSRILNLVWGR